MKLTGAAHAEATQISMMIAALVMILFTGFTFLCGSNFEYVVFHPSRFCIKGQNLGV